MHELVRDGGVQWGSWGNASRPYREALIAAMRSLLPQIRAGWVSPSDYKSVPGRNPRTVKTRYVATAANEPEGTAADPSIQVTMRAALPDHSADAGKMVETDAVVVGRPSQIPWPALTPKEAYSRMVCRYCRESVKNTGIMLHYGKEFCHPECEPPQSDANPPETPESSDGLARELRAANPVDVCAKCKKNDARCGWCGHEYPWKDAGFKTDTGHATNECPACRFWQMENRAKARYLAAHPPEAPTDAGLARARDLYEVWTRGCEQRDIDASWSTKETRDSFDRLAAYVRYKGRADRIEELQHLIRYRSLDNETTEFVCQRIDELRKETP